MPRNKTNTDIQIGGLYEYREDNFGGCDTHYYFVTKIDTGMVWFYEITSPDYVDVDSTEWASEFWQRVK